MTVSWVANCRQRLVILALVCLVSAGCSSGEGRNLPLKQELARESCKKFLTAWQEGRKSQELLPGIIGKDEDWDGGQKLISFEVLPNESNDGSNLHIPVRLTLANPQGQQYLLDVTYIAGTYPKVTVFRD
jgi:hypothetical protein